MYVTYLNLITWTVHFSCTPSICAVKLHWPDILYYWQKALGSSRSIMMACITNSFIKILSQYQVKQNGSSKVYNYYHDFIDRELLLSRNILSQLFLATTSTVLQSPPWSDYPWRNICCTNDHGYAPFFVMSIPLSSFGLTVGLLRRVTWQSLTVKQQLPTLPVHLSSPPVFVVFVLLNL